MTSYIIRTTRERERELERTCLADGDNFFFVFLSGWDFSISHSGKLPTDKRHVAARARISSRVFRNNLRITHIMYEYHPVPVYSSTPFAIWDALLPTKISFRADTFFRTSWGISLKTQISTDKLQCLRERTETASSDEEPRRYWNKRKEERAGGGLASSRRRHSARTCAGKYRGVKRTKYENKYKYCQGGGGEGTNSTVISYIWDQNT